MRYHRNTCRTNRPIGEQSCGASPPRSVHPKHPATRVTLADDQLLKELAGELRARQSAADQLEERAAAALGVHRTAARCVELLLRNGPLSAGELSAKLGLSPSGTTPLLDRLEEAGTVRRVRPAGGRPQADHDRAHCRRPCGGAGRLGGPLRAARAARERVRAKRPRAGAGFLRRANAILGGATRQTVASETPREHGSRATRRAGAVRRGARRSSARAGRAGPRTASGEVEVERVQKLHRGIRRMHLDVGRRVDQRL